MAGILDFLQSPDAQLGIGLLAAGGPTTDPNQTGFGQRLAGAMNSVTANQQIALRAKLMQSQIDENASQNLLRQQQMAAAQQKQAGLESLFSGGGGLQLKGMPVERVAQLKNMYNIDLMPQWEAANVPKQFSANSYALTPGSGPAEYLPDPTKGVGFNGRQITMLPGAENLSSLAGQQAGATARAQANWQEATPVYNDQNQKVIKSRAEVLGAPGGYATEPQLRATAQGDMGANPASLAREVAALKADLQKVPDARSKQMIQEQIDTLLGQAQKYNVAPASAGNVVELSPAEQARNRASAEAQVTQAKGEVVLKQDKQKALDSGNDALRAIDKALNHPGLETGTGLSSKVNPKNYIPGTDAYNFGAVRDQLKGQAFLQAYEKLKGGGQVTEIEGTKAENAMARLNNAQSTPEYTAALKDLRDVVDRGLRRTRGENVPDVPLASNDGSKAPGKVIDDLPKTAAVGARLRDTTTGKILKFDGLKWKDE